jgi:hypothetical protein
VYAAAYDAAVPDTWAVVNGTDPIAWIPKVGATAGGGRDERMLGSAQPAGCLPRQHPVAVNLPCQACFPASRAAPQVGFKRVGKRVNIDGLGNLLVRPSYFELSVVQRGTKPKHHMTGAYAMSLATIIKNQVGGVGRAVTMGGCRWWVSGCRGSSVQQPGGTFPRAQPP